ncbi:MAG: hypothetical protein KF842_11335 [Caulobacter sp.]|nr:hypothetical protein [Caulobacter sp.]
MSTDRTIYGSRGKLALILVIGLIFVAIGVLLVSRPDQTASDLLIAWGAVGFFGLCVLVAGYQLVRPSRLDLTASGFTYTGLFGKSFTVAWSDVETFHVWQNPAAAHRLVAWRYFEGRAPRGAAIGQALGAEGAIPGAWTLSTDRLAALMQSHLEASRK